jgi:RHS repeat-associated protein
MRNLFLISAVMLAHLFSHAQGSGFPEIINLNHIVISGKKLVQPSETVTYTADLLHLEDIDYRTMEWLVVDGTITAQNTDPNSGPVYVTVQWKAQTMQGINYNIPWGTVYLKHGAPPQSSLAYAGAQLEVFPGIYWHNGTSIYPDEQTVSYGQAPCLLTALPDPFNAGGSGTYIYRWERMDNSTFQWIPISGATAATYQPPAMTEATCYRRVTELWSGGLLVNYEESRGVWVYLYNLTPGTIYAIDFVVPFNGQPGIVDEMPYGGTCIYQHYLYRWEVSYNYRDWETVSLTMHYPSNGPLLTKKNTRIRRGVRCGGGAFIYSNILEFHVVDDVAPDENRNYVRVNNLMVKGAESRIEAYQLPGSDKVQSTVYYDGLGRPIQAVSKETGTPTSAAPEVWQDVVGIKSYDPAGRQVQQFLPYVTASDPGKFKQTAATEQSAYYTNPATYNETLPYSQIKYENSPFSRVVNVKLPGTAWAASSGNSAAYDLNDINEDVQMWSIGYQAGDMPTSGGAYPSGRLQKNTFTDDKGKQVIEYYDNYGNLILKKVQIANVPTGPYTGYLCTYNVYDDWGRLRCVITPEATKFLANNSWSFNATNGPDAFNGYCYTYFYDAKGRMVEKKSPGAEKIGMVYDNRNRLVLSQDGNQKNQAYKSGREWTYTLYDNLNRALASGILNTGSTDHARTGLQGIVDLLLNANTQVSITTDVSETITAYNPVTSASFFSGSTSTIHGVSYYDDYSFSGKKNFDPDYDNYAAYGFGDPNVNHVTQSVRTLGFLTGSKTRVLGVSGNVFLASTTYYDEYGRPSQSLEDNIKTGTDVSTLQFHFDGRLMSSFTKHTASGSPMNAFRTLTKNVYDRIGRLTELWKKYGAADIRQISAYVYDELGRPKEKKLGPSGSSAVETLEYSYNLHGSLTGINKDYALKKDWNIDPTKKWQHFFGIHLGYDNRDNLFTAPELNGKLTGVIWNSQGDDVQRRYNYQYDNAGQLVNASFTQRENITDSWNTTKADFSESGYTGGIEYDLNGNIKSVSRKGILPGSAPQLIDDLRYSYYAFSNKLQKVEDFAATAMGANNGKLLDFTDGGNGSATDYDYDQNGNLFFDKNKDIKDLPGYGTKGIRYNDLDKIEEVQIVNKGTIKYIYDAAGNKLQKIFTPSGGGVAVTTSYIGNFIYEGNDLQFILFGEGRLRVIDPVNQSNTYGEYLLIDGNIALPGNKEGVFDYFIKDHMGNMRATVSQEIHAGKNVATMETGRASVEEPLFGQVNANQTPASNNEVNLTRFAKANIPGSPNPTQFSSSSDYVSRLSALNHKLGPNAILKVMAGDIVKGQAKYYYNTNPNDGPGPSVIVNSLVNAFAGVFNSLSVNPLIKGGGANVTNALNAPLQLYLDDQDNAGGSAPKAYLTVLFFDEQFNLVEDACTFDRVTTAGNHSDLLDFGSAQALKNGYAFVYISNESDEQVYFDDFSVEHIRGMLVEESHYYTLGLKIAGISSRKLGSLQNGKIKNIYGFQGVFSEEDEMTGWNEFDLRDYDPQIGRWLQSDPYDEFASGYVGMGNDPANFTDPSGGNIFSALTPLQGALLGTVVGFIGGGLIDKAQGGRDAGAAAIGALLGAIGGFGLAGGFAGVALPPVSMAVNGAVSAAVSLEVSTAAVPEGVLSGVPQGPPIQAEPSHRLIYSSPEAAAIAWGKQYNGESIKHNREYLGVIFRFLVGNTYYYSYNTPNVGSKDGENSYYNRWVPKGAEVHAFIHSHGAYDSRYINNDFSRPKMGMIPGRNDISFLDRQGKDGYLATPDGQMLVRRFFPPMDETLQICECLTRDETMYKGARDEQKLGNFRDPNFPATNRDPDMSLEPVIFRPPDTVKPKIKKRKG